MVFGRAFAGVLAGSLAVVPVLAAENTTSLPDFSGMWGRNAFNFEPIPGGPGPLVNLSRLSDGTGDPGQIVGDFRNPILKPQAAEIVRTKGEISKSGDTYPDPSNRCGSWAPPFTYAMELGAQILQTNDHITMIYSQDDQVRHVRLNASHPRNLKPSPMGDSIGHYEGNTLVVDTVGVEAAPYSMIDRFGVPVTEALHVVERYQLIDGAAAKLAQENYEKREGRVGGVPGAMAIDPDMNLKGLQIQLTIEDPNMFTAPWSANVTYRRARAQWLEQICAEDSFDYNKGMPAEIPKAAKPDF